MEAKNTIVALSSGKGKSAIAVIRLSGQRAFSIAESCLAPGSSFRQLPAKTVGLFTLKNPESKQVIDQVTAVRYVGPQSFTGEDMVELFCHGGEMTVEKILSCLVDCGAVYAGRGEFTRRAYCNGKFDLVRAEAILGIIDSRSERAYSSSVEAYFGGSRRTIQKWKKAIASILRDIEAAIEFPDEDDIRKKENNGDLSRMAEIIKDIEKDVNKREKAKIIEKGINIPIVGISNAGKSSLFNLLLECQRSIVHWEQGTTRDSISEEITIGAEKIRLVDTAGLRETENHVEQIGVSKSLEYMDNSPLVIWVTPSDEPFSEFERTMLSGEIKQRTICIISKEDLGMAPKKKALFEKENIPFVSASLLNEAYRDRLVSFIREQIEKRIGSMEFPEVVRNKRQEAGAKRLLENLRQAQEYRADGEEVCARFLQKALDDISEFVGDTTSQEILNSIFSEFCIGK
jgi:tRNA modification GTPase